MFVNSHAIDQGECVVVIVVAVLLHAHDSTGGGRRRSAVGGGGGGSRDERQASHPVGVASRRPCGGRYDIPVGGVEEERLELAAVEYERLSSGYRIQGGGGARGIRQL